MGLEFLHREIDPAAFDLEAERYCRRRRLDFRYLPRFGAYSRAYSGTIERDASFLLHERGETVGLALVPIERCDGGLAVSIGGNFAPAPAVDGEHAERAAFSRIDEIARASGVGKVALHAVLSTHPWSWNRLRVYGFVDGSGLDAVVDLTLDDAALWRTVRKSYKALINKYSDRNGCETVIVDAASPNRDLHETYRVLHAKCSGRVTREKTTFDLQYEMLLEGNATLFVLRCSDGVVGCAYFLQHGAAVDYFSMVDDPDLASLRLPVSHVLVWAAIGYFKARGFSLLRLSPPAAFSPVEGFGDYCDAKGLGIAHFKHGIATGIATAFRGIRYYDETAFERDLETFRAAFHRSREER